MAKKKTKRYKNQFMLGVEFRNPSVYSNGRELTHTCSCSSNKWGSSESSSDGALAFGAGILLGNLLNN